MRSLDREKHENVDQRVSKLTNQNSHHNNQIDPDCVMLAVVASNEVLLIIDYAILLSRSRRKDRRDSRRVCLRCRRSGISKRDRRRRGESEGGGGAGVEERSREDSSLLPSKSRSRRRRGSGRQGDLFLSELWRDNQRSLARRNFDRRQRILLMPLCFMLATLCIKGSYATTFPMLESQLQVVVTLGSEDANVALQLVGSIVSLTIVRVFAAKFAFASLALARRNADVL